VVALVDTDVMIDFLRGQPQAVAYMQATELPLHLSAITVAELYAGVREGDECAVLSQTLAACAVHPVSSQIAERGGLWRRDYRASHGVGLADAIVAATAAAAKLPLVTLNAKHYPMLDSVEIPYRKN
jgi:predicted nucleic acid-binding protein